MDRSSVWSRATENGSSSTEFDTPSEFHLDSSYVLVVWVIPSRGLIIVCFVKEGQIGYCRDKAADGPVVSMGAKM